MPSDKCCAQISRFVIFSFVGLYSCCCSPLFGPILTAVFNSSIVRSLCCFYFVTLVWISEQALFSADAWGHCSADWKRFSSRIVLYLAPSILTSTLLMPPPCSTVMLFLGWCFSVGFPPHKNYLQSSILASSDFRDLLPHVCRFLPHGLWQSPNGI